MQKLITIMAVIIFTLVCISCDDGMEPDHATVTVINNSDYDVTELYCYWTEPTVVKQGETRVFNIEWAPGGKFSYSVDYYLNGDLFNGNNMEGLLYHEEKGYYNPFYIKDGAKVSVYIKNEGYRLEMIGGEYIVK